jgi:hypothetical protein
MWSPEVAPTSQPLAAHAMTGPSPTCPWTILRRNTRTAVTQPAQFSSYAKIIFSDLQSVTPEHLLANMTSRAEKNASQLIAHGVTSGLEQ